MLQSRSAMDISFDLSEVTDLRSLGRVAGTLNAVTEDLAKRSLIVGATARDLILHHVHGLPIIRATVDLDIAVAIASWQAFDELQARLIAKDARRDVRIAHRFVLDEWSIDVVPFGGVEQDGAIVWPRTDTGMSVIGFEEASLHALQVLLPGNVRMFVASPAGLLILKLIAWEERHITEPRHDAVDIRTLLASYAEGWNEDRLYGEADDLLQRFGYDNALAAAALLGRDCAAIARAATLERITTIVARESSGEAVVLAADMGGRAEQNIALLGALLTGLREAR